MASRTVARLVGTLGHDPLGVAALVLVLSAIVLSAAAPLVTAADPVAVDYGQAFAPPAREHPFGADNYGRDVWARLLYGGRITLSLAAVAVAVIISVSVTIGMVTGYFGGWIDAIVSRVVDVLLAFPRLVLAIAIAALIGRSLTSLLVAVCAVAWPSYARIFRGFVLQVRTAGFVEAARCCGAPAWRILATHILVSIVGPVLVLTMLDIGTIILTIAALSFLGLGVAPPQPEWGAMLNEGRPFLEEAPWLFLAPGLTILSIVLSLNYLGDAVRDAVEFRTDHGARGLLKLWPVRADRARSRRARVDRLRARAGEIRAGRGHDAAVVTVDGLHVAVADRHSPAFGRAILDDVRLELRAGECLGIVGESGSGKSTLALVLMGLVRYPLGVDGGTIRLLGEDTSDWVWDDWRTVRGSLVSLVSQDPTGALNPVLSIRTQLLEAVHDPEAETRAERLARIEDVLQRVQLARGVLDLYPHQLSGGMRQRVAIAMAVANRPLLLIADEPTSALDVTTQARVLELLRELRATLGLAMILISHDLSVMAQVADRVAVMRDGRIVEIGGVDAIFARPANPYTRQLIEAVRRGHVRQAVTARNAGCD